MTGHANAINNHGALYCMQLSPGVKMPRNPHTTPYYDLINEPHDPHQMRSTYQLGLKEIATLSPHLRDGIRPRAQLRPARVPSPLRCNNNCADVLASLSLEKALRDALISVLEKGGGSDARTSFYNKFKEEVAEHDNDLQKKHDEDLNTTLIFVSFTLS